MTAIGLAVAGLCGCGVTMSPVKREPLQITPMVTKLAVNPEMILVRYEGSVPGKPLNETVWDNVSGPVWSIPESGQIGYTEKSAEFVPVDMVNGATPGLTTSPEMADTRLVIPFGSIFEGVFQSGLTKVFPNVRLRADDSLDDSQTNGVSYLVSIKITQFDVWEAPDHHLNLKATVQAKVHRMDKPGVPGFYCETKSEMLQEPIGTAFSTSRQIIRKMTQASNKFAANLSTSLLDTLQKQITP